MLYELFGLFIVLSIADGITTYQALKRPGTREANPVMRWLFDKFGVVNSLVVSKLAVIGIIWYTMGPESVWVLAGWNALYAWTVWNNHFRAGR